MKRNTFKSILTVLLSASLCLGAVACSSASAPAPAAPAAPTSSSAGDAAGTSGPPDELKIHYHSENKHVLVDKDGNLKPVFKLAEEKTNVKIISTANPVSQKSQEEFELQATQKFPADIYAGNSIRNGIFTYGHQGAFIPLNQLIEEHGPNIKKWLDENPDARKAMTDADGSIYMLNYVPDGKAARVYAIRTDWLKKLNLEVPKTVEELEKVLYAFRDNDPNGNGQKDEIPLFNDKFEEIIRTATLWGARVYGEDTYSERIVVDNQDTFYHAWTHPDFKTGLINMARWYKDGIIDPEVFTRKANTARQTLWTKENRGGMTHEWLASTTSYNQSEELLAAVPEFKVEAMLPPTYNGNAFEEHQRSVIKPDGWAISVNCKNPEAAIRLMDWFYTEEGRRAINFGVEGLSYTMVDGKPQFTPEVLKQTGVNLYIQNEYGAQYKIGYHQDYEYERQWTVPEGQEAYDLYSNSDVYKVKYTPILNFTQEEREVYDKYITGLNTYQDEMIQGFITGKFDVNAEWDKYVAKCKELGSEELVALYQKVFDERYR